MLPLWKSPIKLPVELPVDCWPAATPYVAIAKAIAAIAMAIATATAIAIANRRPHSGIPRPGLIGIIPVWPKLGKP